MPPLPFYKQHWHCSAHNVQGSQVLPHVGAGDHGSQEGAHCRHDTPPMVEMELQVPRKMKHREHSFTGHTESVTKTIEKAAQAGNAKAVWAGVKQRGGKGGSGGYGTQPMIYRGRELRKPEEVAAAWHEVAASKVRRNVRARDEKEEASLALCIHLVWVIIILSLPVLNNTEKSY